MKKRIKVIVTSVLWNDQKRGRLEGATIRAVTSGDASALKELTKLAPALLQAQDAHLEFDLKKPGACEWTQSREDCAIYLTQCGETRKFESGGPGDPWNRVKYCQYCGGLVEVESRGDGDG